MVRTKLQQQQHRRLLIRGPMSFEDLNLMKKHLSPTGLILQIVLNNADKVEEYTSFVNEIF